MTYLAVQETPRLLKVRFSLIPLFCIREPIIRVLDMVKRGSNMGKLIYIGMMAVSVLVPISVSAQVEYAYADVIETRPIIQVVEISSPRQQCWEEEYVVDRRYGGSESNTPAIIATILGGAIGNAVGHNKSNKQVGTVVGAVLGHSIGRDIIRRNTGSVVREVETVERCETVYEQHQEERIVGYQVTYNYNGRDYSVRTNTDPGDQIQVRVSVQPVL